MVGKAPGRRNVTGSSIPLKLNYFHQLLPLASFSESTFSSIHILEKGAEMRNSSTFEATPPSPEGSGAKNFFFHIFSWVRSMTPSNFEIDISTKILEKIPPPQGVRPPNF